MGKNTLWAILSGAGCKRTEQMPGDLALEPISLLWGRPLYADDERSP